MLIKTKLASVIVEVAKREWPQTWDVNTLFTKMFASTVGFLYSDTINCMISVANPALHRSIPTKKLY
jgi:hypothetical protein